MAPVELVGRIDLDRLYLPFLEKVLELLANCQKRGAWYYAISGYRTPQEQMRLWCQGRTTRGSIVTNARPWESAHQYGLAVDLCRDGILDRRGLQPDWRASEYRILGEEAEKLGLDWAGKWERFREYPHVGLPGYATAAELAPLKPYAEAGLTELFEHLNRRAA